MRSFHFPAFSVFDRRREKTEVPQEEDVPVVYWSTKMLVKRWQFSANEVKNIVRRYRSEPGWVNFGQPEDVKRKKRRYEFVGSMATCCAASTRSASLRSVYP
jgi:hypothetical protein